MKGFTRTRTALLRRGIPRRSKAMNPLGIVVVALGVALIIVGVSGSQHALVSALTNKPAKSDTSIV